MMISTALAGAGTAGDLIEAVTQVFESADLHYGHGTDNPLDEAAALVFHVMGLDHSGSADLYATEPTMPQLRKVQELAALRIDTRKPLPYLLGEAWFAGLPFTIDERVLVPRSPIAELIAEGFEPWIRPEKLHSILEIGTGSGCIAVACALALPGARVTATDISPQALAVAAANVARYGLGERVQLVETDHAAGVIGTFDLIISNPPYVPADEIAGLPPEYKREPLLGLVSGRDGLDSARRILQDAPRLMHADSFLVLEVGAQWEALDRAFPGLPFTWLEFEQGGTGVALLRAADLKSVAVVP
jgi:ribosomal protein L3 glutamine methyltransferase